MEIKKVAIIGAGTMGHGIAQLCAEAGLQVSMFDISEQNLNNGFENIKKSLKLLLSNGKITEEDYEKVISKINLTNNLEKVVENAEIIIECVAEKLPIKQDLFGKLDKLCSPEVILATNTSGLSPSAISQNLEHPERVVVAHFWCPAELIPLVEVVPGEKTSAETVERTMAWVKQINKQPVKMNKECLGFIGNRLQLALLREAIYIVEQGWADPEEVDKAVEYGLGRRLPVTGPLRSADLGGLDIFYNISTYLFKDLCNSTEASQYLKEKVDATNCGTKSGKGNYKWSPEAIDDITKKRTDLLLYFLEQDKLNK
ncbi:3-hydroxyacyl-CoA dehydrogenase family protein [Clostridium sp. MB40-C1]|uniref:3-hydroxyacyl-CoA dehydrogenase family protein n=1 Tax=Clostridium sp. MB40-C1 TaxID=3070996 RepID=UPI0027E0B4EB|nr:3-hydroxyacyl-CoA dehydrogenase family protein [Clostridium sp. MB40-C1]WMJ80104.1 3-hydroxyacyl-CoA dehydrogenase family protein [Clostridium sp. MB40-C1]